MLAFNEQKIRFEEKLLSGFTRLARDLWSYGNAPKVVKWNHSRIYLARSLKKCKQHNYGRTFDYLITSTDEKQIYFQWPKLFSANSILFTWFLISFFSFLQFNAIILENSSMLKGYNYSTLWLMKLKEIEILHSETDFKGVFFLSCF